MITEKMQKRLLPGQFGLLKKVRAEYIAIAGSLIIAIVLSALCTFLGQGKLILPVVFLTVWAFFALLQLGYIYRCIFTNPLRLILFGLAMIGALTTNFLMIRQLATQKESSYVWNNVFFGLTFAFPLLGLVRISCKTTLRKVLNIIKSVLVGIGLVFAGFFIMETCSGTDMNGYVQSFWLYNLFFLILIAGMVYLFAFRIRISLGIMLLVTLVVGIANGYVIEFRGSPILPADLYLLKTAMQVSGGYDYTPTISMWIGATAFFLALMLLALIKEPRMSHKKRLIGRGIYVAPYVLFFVVGMFAFKANVNSHMSMLNLWQPISNYQRYGTAYGFGMNMIAMQVQKPDNYSQENASAVLDNYTSDEDTVETKPNIIVILCEAFSDLSVVGDFETNEDFLPYYRSYNENIIKGHAYSSVLGGTTADSEYELLTGNAITYLPAGTVPYQQYITDDTLNFTSTLKSQGYYAQALHPYYRNTYRREIVYPLLGFDEYLDMTYVHPQEYLRYYIRDSSDFSRITTMYECRDRSKPFYVYNVTMQNHSPYDLGKMDYNIHVLDGDYPQADEYLSCISATDESLHILFDYFNMVDTPTYILLVGDHQPNLYDGFFEDVMGDEQSKLSLEDLQKRYTVPFLIWSNQDIEEKEVEGISMNYLSSYFLKEAGMPLTAYNKYLLDLYEKYPVVNINGYLDKDKVWHDTIEMKQNEELNAYNMLVYNSVVNNNKGLEWAYQLK